MAAYYLDSSTIVKRYVQEQGTAWVSSLTAPAAGHDLYAVQIGGPEVVAALVRNVRTGEVDLADARRAVANFRFDWRHRAYLIIDVTGDLAERAMDLAERHGTRGYDAVHLAAAVEVHEARSVSGMLVENPNAYP